MLTRWLQQYLQKGQKDEDTDNVTQKVMKLKHLMGAFYILGAGVGLAIIGFLVEMVLNMGISGGKYCVM